MIDDPTTESPPRVYNIPTGLSFVDALADGLVRQAEGDPLRLSAMTVLLPNRRACRALQEAFLRTSPFAKSGSGDHRALLLPRLRPIGDIDEDDLTVLSAAGMPLDLPPAIDPLRRQLLLARLVMASRPKFHADGMALRWQDAVQLAADLARLLDQVETERCDLANLDRLVLGDLAKHWQLTVDFLSILRDAWPAILRAEGAIDVAARRNLLLDHQRDLWRRSPPRGPVIAAGSTGSIPASADLIALVARLPQGSVVLPGLDQDLDEVAWTAVQRDPSHPQFGLAQLLLHIGLGRRDVRAWSSGSDVSALHDRRQIVSEAMLPAECTDRWSAATSRLAPDRAQQAWQQVHRLDCRNRPEEAGAIALILRRHVETPGDQRVALVTPDRQLAAQVAAELRRWNIVIDDFAGHPLNLTPPGAFFLLLAEAAAVDWAPVEMLALLKHPLVAAGLAIADLRALIRDLERSLLRGPRPGPGWDGLHAALQAAMAAKEIMAPQHQRLSAVIDRLAQLTAPMVEWQSEIDLQQRLTVQIEVLEALAMTDEEAGADRLWRQEAGEALADFCHRLADAAAGQPMISADDYAALLSELMSAVDVRPRYGAHPRLFIWGPLEARLQQVELMVLGGLNEGTWPAEPAIDPWLNRPMRQAFGLPQPERRIGLSAHDFQQALGAPEVFLTRSARIEGTPTVPSRWLLRLDAYLRCLGLSMVRTDKDPWLAWQQALDRPSEVTPVSRPAPQPGLAHRPKRLSVTGIEAWMRDPYAIYAQHILKLRALKPLDEDPSLADLGIVIHRTLEKFVRDCAGGVPLDALNHLLAEGERNFRQLQDRPTVWAFWWPRFQRIAGWIVAEEEVRRPQTATSYTEAKASLVIETVNPPFELTARADRIDQRKDGGIAIVDYKTGAIPKMDHVHLGFAPQLPLEAALAQRGAFRDENDVAIPLGVIEELAFWHLNGSDSGGVKPITEAGRGKKTAIDYNQLAEAAYDGLLSLLQHFSQEDASYPARPVAAFAPRYSDYVHLARVLEWSLSGQSDTGEAAE